MSCSRNPCVIVDYGMGNLSSVQRKLQLIGVSATISQDSSLILSADMLILPGVGHFREGMENLRALKLVETLNEARMRSIPILGICLGMQLMTEWSEEGECAGLGWFPGKTLRFCFAEMKRLPIPHVGWNTVSLQGQQPALGKWIERNRFYFTHSYHLNGLPPELVVGWTDYGYSFPSIVRQGRTWGVQFHPEKSHQHGMGLLKELLSCFAPE